MSNKMRGGFGRSVVGVCVAAALLFGVAASPANAEDNPNDTWIRGVLKGDQIVLQEQGEKEEIVFPLGEKDGPNACNPEEKRTQFKAHVDSQKNVTGVEFNFAPGIIEEVPTFGHVCALIEIKNNPAIELDGKQVSMKDPAPHVSIELYRDDLIFFNFNCRIDLGQVGFNGAFEEPKNGLDKDPWDWNLWFETNGKVDVQPIAPDSNCPSLIATLINQQLGLDGQKRTAVATFKWIVYAHAMAPDLK